jgi:tetratricopeptide (TPR) repeat protein
VIPDLFRNNGNEAMGNAGMETAFPQPVHALTTFTEYVLRFPCWMFGGLQNPDPLIRPTRIKSLRFLTALGLFLNAVALALLWEPFRLPFLFMVLAPHAVYVLIPLADQVFEYRFYFGCLGIALLFTTWATMLPVWAATLAIAALASMAAFRVTSWNNWEDFWKAALFSGSAYKSRPLQNLAAFYKLSLRNAEAHMFLRIAVQVNPRAASSLCELADFDEKAGDFLGAEKWLERSIRDCPSFSQGWERMARLQTHLGNKERAAACQEKIAALAAGG